MRKVMKGMHTGKLVLENADLEIKGLVRGDLRIEGDSDVLLTGVVTGNIALRGGKLNLRGLVRGDVLNEGGVLTVRGIVSGKLETLGGQTLHENGLVGSRSQQRRS